MKTLSDFKKRIKPGVKIRVENKIIGYTAERVVQFVKIKEFAAQGEDGKLFWLEYPKAADCTFNGETMTITTHGREHLIYTFL